MEIVPAGQEKDLAVVEVKSDILKIAEEAQVEASAELLANLRQMVNEPTFSDVTFICSDGERVQGSRILASRSDMLKSMFMSGMVESRKPEITLPLISSPVLLSVLEFLYTGTLSDHLPRSWRMACEVVSASRFFLLPNLEKITRKFMHAQTVSVAEDLPKAASLLTEAVGFKTMCEETDVSLRDLVITLSSNWSEKNFVRNLSGDAFHYLLANSKGEVDGKVSPDFKPIPFTEYLRFRQVIGWWVNQCDFDSVTAKELVSLIAPENALSICEDPLNFNSSFGESGCLDRKHSDDWSSLQLNKSSKDSALMLLSNINYQKIHPVLLEKVVEPLKLVSSAEMLNAFRWHALRRHFVLKKWECGWDHGESYTTLEQGYVVKKTGPKIGLAVAIPAIGRSICVYQWSFILEEISDSFCELGFMSYATGVEVVLDGERLSDQHRARVLKIQGGQVAVNWEGAGGGQLIGKRFGTPSPKAREYFLPLIRWSVLVLSPSVTNIVGLSGQIYRVKSTSQQCLLVIPLKDAYALNLGAGLTFCEITDAQDVWSKGSITVNKKS